MRLNLVYNKQFSSLNTLKKFSVSSEEQYKLSTVKLLNMNKKKLAKKISPLVLVPLTYVGAVLIHGAHPPTNELFWTILLIIFVSLPVGYFGMFCIVLPIEQALLKRNQLSTFKLIALCSIGGGILFTILDVLLIPGHDNNKVLEIILVFSMGFILGLAVTLSYCLISGMMKKSTLSLVLISVLLFAYILSISPGILKNIIIEYKQYSIKKIVSNTNIKSLTIEECYSSNCLFIYEDEDNKVRLKVSGSANARSKTELIDLIFKTWPKGARHCSYFSNGKKGRLPRCTVN